ncbi:MAG TPA: ATP-binding protein [Armatimonadetes bacterium]|nr:ATP-binding protein [Armatimonadota bacterium]
MSSRREQILRIPSRLECLREVREWVERETRTLGLASDPSRDLALCVHEAVSNAIVHGNRLDARKEVVIEFQTWEDRVEVRVRDEGGGYDSTAMLDKLHLQGDNADGSGRGLLIILRLMDEVHFLAGGREIVLVKYLTSPPKPPR